MAIMGSPNEKNHSGVLKNLSDIMIIKSVINPYHVYINKNRPTKRKIVEIYKIPTPMEIRG